MSETVLLKRIRILLVFFALALLASGLTAIPLRWELDILDRLAGAGSGIGSWMPSLGDWIGKVNLSVQEGYGRYPLLAYGTDWLAFGHVAIAVSFIGAIRDPLRNRWVVDYGMIVCLLLLPWALIFGAVRGIPLLWRSIDMSFGLFGILPLWLARRYILRLPEP